MAPYPDSLTFVLTLLSLYHYWNNSTRDETGFLHREDGKAALPKNPRDSGKSGLMRFFAIQFACLCWNAAFSQRFSIPVFRCAETQNKEATCLSPSGFLCRNCTQTHAVRLQYHYIHGAWMRQTNSLDDVRRDSGCGCPWRWMEGVGRAGFGEKEGVPSCR